MDMDLRYISAFQITLSLLSKVREAYNTERKTFSNTVKINGLCWSLYTTYIIVQRS